MFDGLGIKEAARSKAALKPMGYLVGEAVENGEAELGLSFMSEFTADEDLAVVSFPAELQKPQLYSIGVFADSANADAARAFIAFVTSPAARAKLDGRRRRPGRTEPIGHQAARLATQLSGSRQPDAALARDSADACECSRRRHPTAASR